MSNKEIVYCPNCFVSVLKHWEDTNRIKCPVCKIWFKPVIE